MGPKKSQAKAAQAAQASKTAGGQPVPSTSSSSTSSSSSQSGSRPSTARGADDGADGTSDDEEEPEGPPVVLAPPAVETAAIRSEHASLLDSISAYKSNFGKRAKSFGSLTPRTLQSLAKEASSVFVAIVSNIYAGALGEGESKATVINKLVPETVKHVDTALGKIPNTTVSLGGVALKEANFRSSLRPIANYYKTALTCCDTQLAQQFLSIAVGMSRDARMPMSIVRNMFETTQYHLTNASRTNPATTSLREAKPKTKAKRISDEQIGHLADFLLSSDISQAAEANAINLRQKTLLSLNISWEDIYRLYAEDAEPLLSKKIHKTSFLQCLTYKNAYKVQSSETAACGTCAQHCYGMFEELQALIIELIGATEKLLRELIERGDDRVDEEEIVNGQKLEKELLAELQQSKIFLLSGYARGCIRSSQKENGSGNSNTFTHCLPFATSDTNIEELQCPCQHDFHRNLPQHMQTAAEPNLTPVQPQQHGVVWGSGEIPASLPDSVFTRRKLPGPVDPLTKDYCALELAKWNQKKQSNPSKDPAPLARPQHPTVCIVCKRKFRRESIIGAEFKSGKKVFQTLPKLFKCRSCVAHAASDNHLMDCVECNRPFWLISKIRLQLDYYEALLSFRAAGDTEVSASGGRSSGSSSSGDSSLTVRGGETVAAAFMPSSSSSSGSASASVLASASSALSAASSSAAPVAKTASAAQTASATKTAPAVAKTGSAAQTAFEAKTATTAKTAPAAKTTQTASEAKTASTAKTAPAAKTASASAASPAAEAAAQRVLFMRYRLQRSENSVHLMFGHKCETLVEDDFLRAKTASLAVNQMAVTRDYASKCKYRLSMEPVCGGGPAGCATNHVYFVVFKTLAGDASLMTAQQVHETSDGGRIVVGSAMDVDDPTDDCDTNLTTRGVFLCVFSNDTKEDSEKVICEDAAVLVLLSKLLPHVTEAFFHSDNAPNYAASSLIQYNLHYFSKGLSFEGDLTHPRIRVVAKHSGVAGECKNRCDTKGGHAKYDTNIIVNQGVDLRCAEDYVIHLNYRQAKLQKTGKRENCTFCMVEYDKSNIKEIDFAPIGGIQTFHYMESTSSLFEGEMETGLRLWKVSGTGDGVFIPAKYLGELITLPSKPSSAADHGDVMDVVEGAEEMQADGVAEKQPISTFASVQPSGSVLPDVLMRDEVAANVTAPRTGSIPSSSSSRASSTPSSSGSSNANNSNNKCSSGHSATGEEAAQFSLPTPARSKADPDNLPRVYFPDELHKSMDDLTLETMGGGQPIFSHKQKAEAISKKAEKKSGDLQSKDEKKAAATEAKRQEADNVILSDLKVKTYPCAYPGCTFRHTKPFLKECNLQKHYARVREHDPDYDPDFGGDLDHQKGDPNTLTAPQRLYKAVQQKLRGGGGDNANPQYCLPVGSSLRSMDAHELRHPPIAAGGASPSFSLSSSFASSSSRASAAAALLPASDISRWLVKVILDYTPTSYPFWRSEFGQFTDPRYSDLADGSLSVLPVLSLVPGSSLFKSRRVRQGMLLCRVVQVFDTPTYEWQFIIPAPEPMMPGFALPKEKGDFADKLDKLTVGQADRKSEVVKWLRSVFDEPGSKVFPYQAWRRSQAQFPAPWDQQSEKQIAAYFSAWNKEKKDNKARDTPRAGGGRGAAGGGLKRETTSREAFSPATSLPALLQTSDEDLVKLTVNVLKDICRGMAVKVTGVKTELISRILAKRHLSGGVAGGGPESEPLQAGKKDGGEKEDVRDRGQAEEEEEEEELQHAEEDDDMREEYASEMCSARWGNDSIANNFDEEDEDEGEDDFTGRRKRARKAL